MATMAAKMAVERVEEKKKSLILSDLFHLFATQDIIEWLMNQGMIGNFGDLPCPKCEILGQEKENMPPTESVKTKTKQRTGKLKRVKDAS